MPQIINALFPANSLQNYTIDMFGKEGPERDALRSKFGALAVDITKSFLMGQITSPLKAITGSGAIKSLSELNGSAQQVMTTVGRYMDKDEIVRITTQIINNAVMSVTTYASREVKQGFDIIMDFPEISYFGQEAFHRFSYKAEAYVANQLTQLYSSGQKTSGLDISAAQDFMSKRVGKVEQKISYISSKVNNFVKTYTDIAAYWVTKSTEYAAMGPDWVEMKVQQLLTPVLDKIHLWIKTVVDGVEEFKAKAINAIIDWLADQLYGIYERIVKKIQAKLQNKAEELKLKAKKEAQIAQDDARRTIEDTTGIVIPQIDFQATIDAAKSMKSKFDLIQMVTKLLSGGGMSEYEQNYYIPSSAPHGTNEEKQEDINTGTSS